MERYEEHAKGNEEEGDNKGDNKVNCIINNISDIYRDEERYEIDFLNKYIEKKAKERKDKIMRKIERCKNEDLKKSLEYELHEVEKELNEEKGIVNDMNTNRNEEIQSLKSIERNINVENDNDEEVFYKNLKEAIIQYSEKKNVNLDEGKEVKDVNSITEKLPIEEILKVNGHNLDNLTIPKDLWDILFPYQKEGVIWMNKLYINNQGGVLADEMGLGKTLQVITFISSLFLNKKIKYVLVVVPSTIMIQWIIEWKRFYSFLRVCIVHKSQTDSISSLLRSIKRTGGVSIISYEGFKKFSKLLRNISWDYLILDEGHKIKNRESKITKYAKEFSVKYKLILTGTPIQNNLTELWNIFDFVNPGLLGSYSSFTEEYEEPINKGGYTNASKKQIEKGYRTSLFLRNLIEPNILRRVKSQVANQLPKKVDKVVFCPLSEIQIELYKKSLEMEYISNILEGKGSILAGIDLLRKVCNHPYLFSRDTKHLEDVVNVCGKMVVLDSLLEKWNSEGRKVLVFSQTIIMLNIIEKYVKNRGYKYLRMDGTTGIKLRNTKINKFNEDKEIFCFILTTKVGGLGISLVGASRVIIYDPDWNPTTDNQAKERVWRYGQVNVVEIYRFISVNTIEEKIYQKQIFKNLLAKKILKDPRITKFFTKLNLSDLFSYERDDSKVGVVKKERIKDKSEREEPVFDFFGMSPDYLKKMNGDSTSKIDEDMKKLLFSGKKLLTGEEMVRLIIFREKYICDN